MNNKIDGKYEYFAFISYRWEDEKMAKWLQEKLEHYKLPTSLREQNPDLPTHIRPIFRDKTDLNGQTLEESLMSALELSRYLIVICSPLATQSEWVNRGIQRFIDLGREKDIIPFIVDGEANADDPKNECFPLALRSLKGERAIYGININDNGRDAAAVKVVSRMFDVKYDTLWNRFLLEQKKRRRYTIAGLVAAFLVVVGVAGYIWTQNQELDKRNLQIETQYKELQAKNAQIEQQNKDLDAKSDSIKAVNDSIQRAYEKLNISEKNLAKSNADLKESNVRLDQEIEKVRKTNWELLGSQSQAISEKASLMINDGKYVEAAAWVSSVLPDEQLKSRPLIGNASSILYNAHVSFVSKSLACLIGHADEVSFISFSQDNRYVVTASYDGTAKIWHDNKIIATINVGPYPLTSAIFNKSATKVLVSTNGNGAQIWDIKTNKIVKHFHKGEWVQSAVFSNDEKKVLLSDFNFRATIWDVEAETMTKTLSGHRGGVLTSSFSPDGQLIITGAQDGTAKVWNSSTGKYLYSLSHPKYSFVNSAQFCYNGKYILTATDECVKIWDLKSKKELRTITGHKDKISSANFSEDGQFIVTSSVDGTVKIWSVEDGRELFTLEGHTRGLNYATFNSTSSMIATASKDYTARLWEFPAKVPSPNYDGDYISDSPDKQYVVTHDYLNSSQIADICIKNNGEKLFSILGESNILHAIFSNDSRYVAILSTDSIAKIGVISSKSVLELKGHSNRVSFACFSPDNHNIATSSWDNSAIIWDLNTRKCKHKLIGHKKGINSVVYSKDGNWVVTASDDNSAIIWSTKTGKSSVVLKGHINSIKYASFSYDGRYVVTCSADMSIRIWESKTGNLIKIFKGHTDCVNSAVFTEDSNFIISASNDGTVKVWYIPYNTYIYSIGEKFYSLNTQYEFADLSQDKKSLIAYSVGEPVAWPYISITELIKIYTKVFEKYPYDYLHRDVPWAPWNLNVVK